VGTGRIPESSEPVGTGQFPESSEPVVSNNQGLENAAESSESSYPESASEVGSNQDYSTSSPSQESAVGRVEQFIISHLFHNLVTSVLEIPHFFLFHDLKTLFTMEGSHWDEEWLGRLLPGSWVLIALNLVLISLGIGIACKRWSVAGLLPLSIYFGYLVANAIARTSGGRYLIPFDWILFLYFAVGCFQIVFWVLSVFGFDLMPNLVSPSHTSPISFKLYLFVSISFLVLGTLIPLTEVIKSKRYTASFNEIVQTMIVQGDMAKLEINAGDLDTFFTNSRAILVEGRALYPRYYYGDQGEPGSAAALKPFEFPRFVFRLISPGYPGYVMLPASISPDPFPHTSDVIVLGCVNDGGWIDAYAVILSGATDTVYLRDPAAEFACPLPVPICNDNHVCH